MGLQVGGEARFGVRFRTGRTLADPTAITLTVTKPDGSEIVYSYAGSTVTRDGTGRYHKDVTLDQSGWWHWYWQGTGAVIAAHRSAVEIAPNV